MKQAYIDEDTGLLIRPQLYEDWKLILRKKNILYIPSIIGIGATTAAITFGKMYFSQYNYIDCQKDDIFQLDHLVNGNFDKRRSRLIIIDEAQTLERDSKNLEFIRKIFENYDSKNLNLKFLIITDGFFPQDLKKIFIKNNMEVINPDTIFFSTEDVKLMFSKLNQKTTTCLQEACFYYTNGHAMQVSLWLFYVKSGEKKTSQINDLVKSYFFDYAREFCINSMPLSMYKILIKLSIWTSFTINMAKLLLDDDERKQLSMVIKRASKVLKKDSDVYTYIPEALEFFRFDTETIPFEELKKLYCKAGNFYEKKRYFLDAIRCYEKADEKAKFIEIVSLLAENGDGSVFAKQCYYYLKQIPKKQIESNPSLLAAKAMVYSYSMMIEESEEYIEKLKKYVNENICDRKALKKYLRLLVTVNHVSPDIVLDRMEDCIKLLGEGDTILKNITPTGCMPSALNGRLDLCSWIKDAKQITNRVDMIGESVLGKEVIGWKEVFLGEIEYLQNKKLQAISTLTLGITNSSVKGVIKIQFAGIGVLAKCFIADNQFDKALEILDNIAITAKKKDYTELLPSIYAMIGICYLKVGNLEKARTYFKNLPVFDGHFFLSERFYIYSNALFSIAQGNYSYAIYLLYILKDFAQKYNRYCIKWKVDLLISVILFRKKNDGWKEIFLETVKDVSKYNLVRIIADEGVILTPLFNQTDFKNSGIDEKFLNLVKKELKQMEILYPRYLQKERINIKLTNQELKVVSLIIEGKTNKEISQILNISLSTTKKEVSSILKKLGATNRASVIKIVYKQGII